MSLFIKKTIFFFLIVSGLFWGFEIIFTQGLRQSKAYHFGDWNKIYEGELDADLVVSGSSKACVHLDPLILDSVLAFNTYNLGVNGYLFSMEKYRYDVFKANNRTPKVIIQVVSNGTLGKRKDLYALQQFLPYIDDPIIREATKGYKGFGYADYYLPFVRYFGHRRAMLDGFSTFLGIGDNPKVTQRGYTINELSWDNSFERYKRIYPNGRDVVIEKEVVKLFKAFLKERQEEGVKVILVYPPTYVESQPYINNRKEIMELYQSIADEFQIPFWDYSNLPIASDTSYFYNSQHLNRKGALLFSNRVALDIKKAMK